MAQIYQRQESNSSSETIERFVSFAKGREDERKKIKRL